jgi:hypothetical protein
MVHLESSPTAGLATMHVRLALVPLAVGIAFLFDDVVGASTVPVPIGVAQRRLVRLLVAVPLLGVLWTAVLAWAAAAQGPAAPGAPRTGFALPVWAFTLELAGLVCVTLAAAAVAIRARGGRSGGVAAVPVLLLVVCGSMLLPPAWTMWPAYAPAPPGGLGGGEAWQSWTAAHWRWALLAGAALAVAAWASRDAARRRAVPAGIAALPFRSGSHPADAPAQRLGNRVDA